MGALVLWVLGFGLPMGEDAVVGFGCGWEVLGVLCAYKRVILPSGLRYLEVITS